MHIKLLVCLTALLGSLIACAGETASQDPSKDPTPTDPAAATSDEQNLTGKKKCGAFLHGTCPNGYSCDMSGVPHGNVGGAGVCRKTCVQNGVCAISMHFDHATCKCVPNILNGIFVNPNH